MRLIVIGNGMAATRLIASLTERAPGRFTITVFGEESEHASNRWAGKNRRSRSACRMTPGITHGV